MGFGVRFFGGNFFFGGGRKKIPTSRKILSHASPEKKWKTPYFPLLEWLSKCPLGKINLLFLRPVVAHFSTKLFHPSGVGETIIELSPFSNIDVIWMSVQNGLINKII